MRKLASEIAKRFRWYRTEPLLRALYSLGLNPRRWAASETYDGLMALGRAGEAVGRPNEAISAYEAALAIEPTDSIAATARAILLLRRAWGNPLPSPLTSTRQ